MPSLPRNAILENDSCFHVTWQCHNQDWLLKESWAKQLYYQLLLHYKDRYGIRGQIQKRELKCRTEGLPRVYLVFKKKSQSYKVSLSVMIEKEFASDLVKGLFLGRNKGGQVKTLRVIFLIFFVP